MRTFLLLILLLLLNACSDLGYYWHTANGHMTLMNNRVDIDVMLEDPELEPKLRERLRLVKEIRDFSVETLSLPESDSYNNYVQLDRPYALKNLFAATEFSTDLHVWCYPIVGCASYRGYYDEDRLAGYVEQLKAQNFDTYIGFVPAYSTLGWFDDPVLSSFIYWPDYRLAGLLFHELTHQRIFIENDTRFNESLASAVQQAGTELWLKSSNRSAQQVEFRRSIEYQREVVGLIEQTRETLTALYQGDQDETIKRVQKQVIFANTRESYVALAQRLNYRGGYESWFAGELNNAKLGSVSAYHEQLPAFLAILKARNYDFSAFFDTVEGISELEKAERDACLTLWSAGKLSGDENCALDS
ncbi:MAG: aminopeptidase [Gammaproteobacteria bacterium]|nr:MAG: aminopeptidase [Gammaproteobacteria bacterium]